MNKELLAPLYGGPEKNIPTGSLVRFVCAPPRWDNESPRDPGSGLYGETAIVLSKRTTCEHAWGGRFELYMPSEGVFDHWGDFLEIVE
jgi:hypothetical protein|tara:strand:- start:113 stop:376 length:264 start_codon:yes stop_codon:yes gene_type:complete